MAQAQRPHRRQVDSEKRDPWIDADGAKAATGARARQALVQSDAAEQAEAKQGGQPRQGLEDAG